ncbi:hypothetical protein L1887_52035 [Cichorium endivia]|nr:hypothetical protein L1887_52035 [Cichorium endivia]
MNAVSARFSSSALMIDDGSFRLGKNVAVMRVNCQGTVKLWTVRSARGRAVTWEMSKRVVSAQWRVEHHWRIVIRGCLAFHSESVRHSSLDWSIQLRLSQERLVLAGSGISSKCLCGNQGIAVSSGRAAGGGSQRIDLAEFDRAGWTPVGPLIRE